MMLQKIAGSSQTIRAPKGLLRAGAPSPRRQMTSKMAPAQQSSSLLFLFLSPPTDFCFSLPPFFSSFCFKTSCRATFEDGVFGGFGKFVLWGVCRLQFNLCLYLYWFHKVAQILARHLGHMCISCLMIFALETIGHWLVEYCLIARLCQIFNIILHLFFPRVGACSYEACKQ